MTRFDVILLRRGPAMGPFVLHCRAIRDSLGPTLARQEAPNGKAREASQGRQGCDGVADLWAAQKRVELMAQRAGQPGYHRTLQDALRKYSEEVSLIRHAKRREQVRLAPSRISPCLRAENCRCYTASINAWKRTRRPVQVVWLC